MSLALAVMILLIALIIAALAIYLIATIGELIKINKGLASVLNSVGEIVAKSAPVNGVVDAINGNLVAGRNLLENLFIKKAGSDTAGLVESLFPGEGAKFNQRVGKNYPVVNTGIVYTRGTQILASLGRGAPIGAAHAKGPAVRDPKYATTAAAMLYPRPGGDPRARPKSPVVGKDSPRQYESAGTPGVRPRNRDGSENKTPDMPTGTQAAYSPPALFQRAAPAAPPPAPEPPAAGGGGGDDRLNVKGKRPWER
ncbi:MAG: hypothetical protein Q8K63_09110 [Acidimicrobiales bacterium]|nr:hypothetical protein [Acidimicrobiales bacterium]